MTDFDLSAAEGHVVWRVSLGGVELPSIQLQLPGPVVVRLVLTPRGLGTCDLEVITSGLFDPSDAADASRSLVEELISNLAVLYGARIFDARLVGHTLPDRHRPGIGHLTVNAPLSFDIAPPPPTPLAEGDVIAALNDSAAPGLSGVRTSYRVGSAQSDPVASFMMLYNALLQLNNDKQRDVDQAILSHSPQTPISPSPIGAGNETVYTRLRNEIGHKRAGVDLVRSRREIREVLPEFSAIVRDIVLQETR